jgi:hypothetical protein
MSDTSDVEPCGHGMFSRHLLTMLTDGLAVYGPFVRFWSQDP